jgi:hypothetical protein
LDELAEKDQLDWERVSVDSAAVPAPFAPKESVKKGAVPNPRFGDPKKRRKPLGQTRQTGASKAPKDT